MPVREEFAALMKTVMDNLATKGSARMIARSNAELRQMDEHLWKNGYRFSRSIVGNVQGFDVHEYIVHRGINEL